MFRAIDASCRKQGYKPKSRHAEFDGFDGNNDHPQYGFAHFVRRHLGQWGELKDRPDNSPAAYLSANIGTCCNLVPSGQDFDLTPGQIEMVADAK